MTIKINGTDYSFKTAFMEFTIEDYLSLVKSFALPIPERIAAFAGIPIETLSGLSIENYLLIAGAVSFIEKEDILNALADPLPLPVKGEEEKYKYKDIALRSFEKLEKAKAMISGGDMYGAIVKITELYTKETIAGQPLCSTWHKCRHYLLSLSAFFERFRRLNLHEYTDEELEADVELLEGFKHYPIVFRMGAERGMTNDEVLAMPAIEVYTQLLYEYERGEYEKRYNQIVQNRQEHFSKLAK